MMFATPLSTELRLSAIARLLKFFGGHAIPSARDTYIVAIDDAVRFRAGIFTAPEVRLGFIKQGWLPSHLSSRMQQQRDVPISRASIAIRRVITPPQ